MTGKRLEFATDDTHKLKEYIELVRRQADQARRALNEFDGDGIALLREIKFNQIGWDPLSDRPLNLIEQVNQTFTYLVSFRAAQLLMQWFPDCLGIRLNLGTSSGWDIESLDGRVIGEAFAATNPKSNNKINKDLARLNQSPAPHRHAFFACPGYAEGRQPQFEQSGITVWAVEVG